MGEKKYRHHYMRTTYRHEDASRKKLHFECQDFGETPRYHHHPPTNTLAHELTQPVYALGARSRGSDQQDTANNTAEKGGQKPGQLPSGEDIQSYTRCVALSDLTV